MPNKFCCRNCGMITDNPTIVPHPDKDAEYRELFKTYETYWQNHDNLGHFYLLNIARYEGMLKGKYNHSITCPVCENETRFWRDTPFPTDTLTNKEKLAYYLASTPKLPTDEPTVPICQKCGSLILIHYRGKDLTAECGCTLVQIECLDKRRWQKTN